MQQFQSFGTMLYWLRVTHGQRVARAHPGVPVAKSKLTQAALIDCLENAGYNMSAATYSEIEAGTTFPRDARLFLDTVSKCLELDERERWEFGRQLAFDLLKSRVDEKFAVHIFGSPPD